MLLEGGKPLRKFELIKSPTIQIMVSLTLLCLIVSSPGFGTKSPSASVSPTNTLESPKGTEIIKQLKTNFPNRKHPRIIVSAEDFTRIKKQVNQDPFSKSVYLKLKPQVDKVLSEPAVRYELPDGVRLLEISRKALTRIINLSLFYRLTGETKYADRAWLELKTICDPSVFADWHSEHYLDTAEMCAAAAIGFDWLYDYLDDQQKKIIVKALEKNALNTALEIYDSGKGWPLANHNWNAVCNGGIGLGAIAIGDESPALSKKAGSILEKAIHALPNMMKEFAPDGAWGEGVGYWEYANQYLCYFISTMDLALGTDYGISNFSGYSETGYFPIYLTGPNGTFNFADSGKGGVSRTPALLWLATKFRKPEYAWYAEKNTVHSALDLVWYREGSNASRPLQNDYYFRNVEIASFHSRLGEADDLFVGFKAGNNRYNHGDLDLGDFVIDAFGKRWAEELGKDNYNLPRYFQNSPLGRWSYYRKRAEGQNTLVINPSNQPDQDPNAKAKIIRFQAGQERAFAIADLTMAYPNVLSVKRGIGLIDHKTKVIVQDEIKALKPAEVWWFMHTTATIAIQGSGDQALLSQKDQQFLVKLISPQKASFVVMKAAPLPSSPNPPGQAHQKNNPYQKLAIHLENVDSESITVVMIPLNTGTIKPEFNTAVTPLAEWK